MDDTEQTDSEFSSLHQFGILNAIMECVCLTGGEKC